MSQTTKTRPCRPIICTPKKHPIVLLQHLANITTPWTTGPIHPTWRLLDSLKTHHLPARPSLIISISVSCTTNQPVAQARHLEVIHDSPFSFTPIHLSTEPTGLFSIYIGTSLIWDTVISRWTIVKLLTSHWSSLPHDLLFSNPSLSLQFHWSS